ncbi:MAG: DinB family protein [Chloroflexi bacterium]|nr:DinB family protein [Chloroflexota bacterium]
MNEHFVHADMGGAEFRDVNLGGAVFDNVNLAGASFNNINFAGAKIRDANLQNMAIEDANLTGFTVMGVNIEPLIEAELDRREPERARVRIDIFNPTEVKALISWLDAVRAAFRAVLRASSPSQLRRRPAENEWNALEVVRHMLFAEDVYINRFILNNARPLNKAGMLPEHLRSRSEYQDVGSEAVDDLETILAAWDAVHADTLAYVAQLDAVKLRRQTTDMEGRHGTPGAVLQLLARHDIRHIRQAERALATLY